MRLRLVLFDDLGEAGFVEGLSDSLRQKNAIENLLYDTHLPCSSYSGFWLQ